MDQLLLIVCLVIFLWSDICFSAMFTPYTEEDAINNYQEISNKNSYPAKLTQYSKATKITMCGDITRAMQEENIKVFHVDVYNEKSIEDLKAGYSQIEQYILEQISEERQMFVPYKVEVAEFMLAEDEPSVVECYFTCPAFETENYLQYIPVTVIVTYAYKEKFFLVHQVTDNKKLSTLGLVEIEPDYRDDWSQQRLETVFVNTYDAILKLKSMAPDMVAEMENNSLLRTETPEKLCGTVLATTHYRKQLVEFNKNTAPKKSDDLSPAAVTFKSEEFSTRNFDVPAVTCEASQDENPVTFLLVRTYLLDGSLFVVISENGRNFLNLFVFNIPTTYTRKYHSDPVITIPEEEMIEAFEEKFHPFSPTEPTTEASSSSMQP